MNINPIVLGPAVLIIAVILGLISYQLGKRKTHNPVIAGVFGFILSLVPLLGIIYIIILLLKKDVTKSEK